MSSDQLNIGTLTDEPHGEAILNARKFNRHTFWCGQSGSGKTYALGVLLEQLLAQTNLPIVIFDPNADFVRLNEPHPDAAPDEVNRIKDRRIEVLRPAAAEAATGPLRTRFTALPIHIKAALLRIDPVIDREEYNGMLHIEQLFNLNEPQNVRTQLDRSDDPIQRALGQRIENLNLLDWEIWARDQRAATEVIATRPDLTVLDLGGFRYAEESLVVALSVLDDLWVRREERRPVLLVIDEAHNLCSPDLETTLGRAVREQIIRIAAEGRKYGLWLLLSTQRPSKVHQGIISQCDNLALMKMGSPSDLDELASVFGFAPTALLEQAPHFRQGQGLFAGGFMSAPAVVQMRGRITHEGGKDVAVPLRESSAP
jgi:DNA helicase HerA-like ATPase